jgi:outer membrane protein assembly factor BamB
MDARFTPEGDVVIAEMNSNKVTVRDTQGRVKATRTTSGNNRSYGNPQQVQVLDNGNLLVTCRNVVYEFAKDKDEVVMTYPRTNTYDIAAAHRLPTGETLVMLQNAPDHAIFIDAKGKEIADRKLKTGMPVYQSAHVVGSGENQVLVTEQNQVAEYDLKTGKKVWFKTASQPRSVQRLPNGNTLYVEANTNRLVEVTPDGEEVWTYQPTNGMQLFRGYRR